MHNVEYNFDEFQKNAVIRFLDLNKYQYIIKEKNKTNIDKDEDYQRTFNKFFRIRRNEQWRKIFLLIF